MASRSVDRNEFLNVDLDIYSRHELQPLVDATGSKVDLVYLGRHKRTWEADIEISRHPLPGPDAIIRQFCKLILGLPEDARDIWDRSSIRQFNVGIEKHLRLSAYSLILADRTVKSMAELNARIVVTIYPKLNAARSRLDLTSFPKNP
jgi:hypothetical protein